jgi:hypothetical protein
LSATKLGRDALLLRELAAPLSPVRAPFYISGSTRGLPDGWYWQPQGVEKAGYLGRNVIFAERRLLELLQAHHTSDAAAAG